MTDPTSEAPAGEEWGLWEHDKYEPDLYVRFRKDAEGNEYTDYLGLDDLNALTADLATARARIEELETLDVEYVAKALRDAGVLPDGFNQLMRQHHESFVLVGEQLHAARAKLTAEREAHEEAERVLYKRVQDARARNEELEAKLALCGGNNCMGLEVDGVASWVRRERLEDARARIEELEERLRCKAPIIQYDPDCDHDSDPIEKALYIVANNVAKHTMSGKHWDCQDTCWLEDLEASRAIIRSEIDAARAEAERLRAKAELADEEAVRKTHRQQASRLGPEFDAFLGLSEEEADWLTRYDAFQPTHEQGGEGR